MSEPKYHRYNFFGKGASSRLYYMGGWQLEWGVKLIVLMLIVKWINIPITEVQMVKNHPAWNAVFVLLIVWCVFWFLDGFIANFLDGYVRECNLFYSGMLSCIKDNAEIYGFKRAITKMKYAVSYENYLRLHPAFEKKLDALRCYKGEEYKMRLKELYKEEGIYVKDGWKVRRRKKDRM